MLANHKLILDTFCEVYDLLQPYQDGCFWNFFEHHDQGDLVDGAIYVIGRQQTRLNSDLIRQLVDQGKIQVVFSDPSEGSDTLRSHCKSYKIHDLVLNKKIAIIAGGEMESVYSYILYENFLPKLYDYTENLDAASRIDDIFCSKQKPYKFLFLNGRTRPHRQYLLERFSVSGLIDQSLWTNLDSHSIPGTKSIPIKYLPPEYEVDRYQEQISLPNSQHHELAAKRHLFKDEWGEIYLKASPYIDTYFSLVTETVHAFPESFRTEKIYKPIAIGHPFIVVANAGYYRDLHNLGFQTFGHVLDETFDQIDNNGDRLARVAEIVEDLCQQDLASFLKECYNVCKYNQQHMAELRPKIRQEFPARFQQFINERFRI